MNRDKIFFTEKQGAVIKTKRGEEVPFPVESEIFREIVREILKQGRNNYNIVVCKAMTRYTGGLKLMRRTESYYTSEWHRLKRIVRDEAQLLHQKGK